MAENEQDKGGTATIEPPKNKGGRPPLKRSDATAADVAAQADGSSSDNSAPDGAPKLGEDVFYILGNVAQGKPSPNAGERRAAKIARLWPDGSVNLTVFAGRANDAPGAGGGVFIHPGCNYDANGANGTWHRDGDPASFKE